MHSPLSFRSLARGPASPRLFLLALAALVASCERTESPVAPSRGALEFSSSSGPSAKGTIAFHSDRDGDGEIYVMNADGSGVTQLTFNPFNDFAPAWSPVAKQIAFTTDRDGNDEIYVMNADGTGVTRLTNNAGHNFLPAWTRRKA